MMERWSLVNSGERANFLLLRPIDVLPIVPKGTVSPGAVGLRAPKSRKTPSGVPNCAFAPKEIKALKEEGRIAEDGLPVIRRIHKPGKVQADPLRGLFPAMIEGKRRVVEYEPDSDLRDSETVPLTEPGGIEAFIRREVLQHAPDAWCDEGKTTIGYEISFTRYFLPAATSAAGCDPRRYSGAGTRDGRIDGPDHLEPADDRRASPLSGDEADRAAVARGRARALGCVAQ